MIEVVLIGTLWIGILLLGLETRHIIVCRYFCERLILLSLERNFIVLH
jgi:hypothetical protein